MSEDKIQPPEITERTMFVLGVSGGKDSAAALIWLVKESGIPISQIRATFSNIKQDHQATIDHVKMLSETLHPIETLHPEIGFFDLALKKKRFPSATTRFCTEHLKIYPAQDYIQRLRGEGYQPIAVSGVRADESEDRKKLEEWDYSGNLLCYSWRPLIRWTIKDVYKIHAKYGIRLNPLYAMGAERVGCWPCVMAKKKEIRIIALNAPDRIDEIRAQEQRHEDTNGQYNGFFHGNTVPPRFRSKDYTTSDGREIKIATIDDVVRWSLTGHRAKGTYLDNPEKEPIGCNSGFCE